MPKPLAGESKKDYLKRCMAYGDMQKYEDKQRYAICNSMWDKRGDEHALAILDLEILSGNWNEEEHPRHPKGEGDGGKFAPKGDNASKGVDPDRKKKDMEGESNRTQMKNDIKDANKLIEELEKQGDEGIADEVRENKDDWRRVMAHFDPDHVDYADDPTSRDGILNDWQESTGAEDLSEYLKNIRKEFIGKHSMQPREGHNMKHDGPHVDADGDPTGPEDCVKCHPDTKGDEKPSQKEEHARVEVVSSGRGGERINFNAAFALKESDPDKGTMLGTASMFGSMIDTFPPTKMSRGAFKKTLADKNALKRVKILYQHNTDWPIGKPISLTETQDGLQVAAAISKTTMGQDVLTLMKDGVIDELSVGFDPVSWRMVKEEGQTDLVRHLDEVHLWEISAVTFAADRNARIHSVHSVQPFGDLPLAEADHAWDAGAAIARIKEWAGGDSIDYGKYKKAFVWCGEPHDEQGSYKLPIADVIDGSLKAVPRAIFAAAARLSSTDIPADDKKKVQAHLTRYYKKLDRQPPWSTEEASNIRSMAEWLASLPMSAGAGRQAKALAAIANEVASNGGVKLTARSRSYIEEAIVAFQRLLQSTEPPLDSAATERQRQNAAIGQRLRELNLVALEAGILI